MQSRLTPSRKHRRAAARAGVEWVDTFHGHCQNLETLAGLLAASDDTLAPELVANAGHLLGREIRQVRALLDQLGKEAR
jgi:hypothetical protein